MAIGSGTATSGSATSTQASEGLMNRRDFLKRSAFLAAGAGLAGPGATEGLAAAIAGARGGAEPIFKISLAQWSLHRTIFGGQLDPLDFARVARNDFGIDAVEYVNQFYKGKGEDRAY